ncbi:MAG: MFS transporter [Methanothrix sp.]|nr:MFS transporter [Methanothrix sp.]
MPGNILLLGLVSLLNDISSEIIQPILPLLITSLGGGSLAVGLIGGLSDGLPSLLQLVSGYWSDRTGKRKPLVIAGYAISAASKLLLPLSAGWQHVLLLRSLERCGKGVRTAPRDALICESADTAHRGRGFGLHRAMDSLGAVIGALLAYLLWRSGLSLSSIILLAGALALLALLPFQGVREGPRASPAARMDPPDLPPDLLAFIAIASLFALGNFSYMFFLLRAGQLLSGGDATGYTLLLYVLFNLVYSSLSIPVGRWSDRSGRRAVLALGYALFAVTAVGFASASSPLMLTPLFILYGAVNALVSGSQSAFVSDLSRSSARSTSLGLYYGAVGISSVLSGLLAGLIWEMLGPAAAFLFGALPASLAALAIMLMRDVRLSP